MSEQTRYWIKGFLYGNEPDQPYNDEEGKLFSGEEYERWFEAVQLFHETGHWNDMEGRVCDTCGKDLLPSEMGVRCRDCAEGGA
ncbi:hypothetical protein QWJ34_12290 [Saccharibacillus sp. CPCC 101409]|uniref:hypothetical protein n=1 Tax=Saccharibacillus sp. CPCC 101409 TaxID=3058041 RepID=UPI0026721890|nr:hypothetical protein [Saccharibacillus sp. CPCC 101409]MDO3410542.1 hypothetical protein [Saccharibacillus sp. CPCC 101409]